MPADYHTIDNLPPSANNTYAQAREELEKAPRIQEALQVVGPAQADVLASTYTSAVRAFVGQDQTNVPIATFEPPAIWAEKRTGLYRENIIPRMSNETLQLVKENLESLSEEKYGQ